MLGKLWGHQVYTKLSNCEFWLNEVNFLEPIISQKGVVMDPSKIKAVIAWSHLTTVHEIISFLRLIGYHQRFVESFSSLSGLLTTLTNKNAEFVWTERYERSFQKLREVDYTPILTLLDLHNRWLFPAMLPNLV